MGMSFIPYSSQSSWTVPTRDTRSHCISVLPENVSTPTGISCSLIHNTVRVICNQMLTEFAVGVGGPGHGRKPSQLMVMIDR